MTPTPQPPDAAGVVLPLQRYVYRDGELLWINSCWRDTSLCKHPDVAALESAHLALQAERDRLAAELERRQALWTQVSLAITRRSTEAIREQYKGNTPEWICGEVDGLTAIFAERDAALAELARVRGLVKPAFYEGAVAGDWDLSPASVEEAWIASNAKAALEVKP